MIIEYKFNLLDRVKVTELELTGLVISVWSGKRGNEIEVRVFINGKPEYIYFLESELELCNATKQTTLRITCGDRIK